MSLVLKGCSSYGSTLVDEEEANVVHLVDEITEPRAVKQYVPQQLFSLKVAIGQAWPAKEGMQLHYHPMPRGYAMVSIDRILEIKFNKTHLDHPQEEDRIKLGDNRDVFVAWRKCYKKFDKSSSDDDDGEGGPIVDTS
jgi:hypothetical protein